MRFLPALLILMPAVAAAQPPADKQATLHYIAAHRDPGTGAFKATPGGKPSLRACNAAVKAIRYLGGKLTEPEKVAAFVVSCYDPATGGFAEPGGKPDVGTTSVGVMAAVELGVPKAKFVKAMDYLKANAKTFEDVRIGAAAVEAWGVKDCPFDLGPWFAVADEFGRRKAPASPADGTRDAGSLAAFRLRLGKELPARQAIADVIRAGQKSDGGWGKAGSPASDMETTYRVVRACMLMHELPADAGKLTAFIGKCRNPDGGSGTKPGEVSSLSGVYYAAIVSHWVEELSKK